MTSYPPNFLSRPVDRDLLQRLKTSGVPADTAELTLYRIWQDFASGGSDRRQLADGTGNLQGDRSVDLLEDFCQWTGGRGQLAFFAVEAGFLTIETESEGSFLVCKDFYPINSRFSAGGKSFQRKGAYVVVCNRELKKADAAAARHIELWERQSNTSYEMGTPETREKVALFIHSVCNCAAKPLPADSVLRGGVFNQALKCLESTDDKQREGTLLYLISLRKDQSLPADLAGILSIWTDLCARAKREGYF